MYKLAAMIDDTENHQLFQRNGPLSWFSLSKTFVVPAKKGSLIYKQCDLIDKVYGEYKDLKHAAREFCGTEECRGLGRALQELQKAKPKAVASEERSRSQRLSRIVHALFGHKAIHVGDFDEAERLVGEMANARMNEIWELLHSARRRYLHELYHQKPPPDSASEIIVTG